MFKAALGICRKRRARVAEAQDGVTKVLGPTGIDTVSISGKEAEATLNAYSRYGKASATLPSAV